MYLGLLPLCDTFCNPNNVAILLLPQFEVRVKDSKVELLQESQSVKLHLWRDPRMESEISFSRETKSFSLPCSK